MIYKIGNLGMICKVCNRDISPLPEKPLISLTITYTIL